MPSTDADVLRIVAHVAVHEGGPNGERGRWVGLLLLLRACQQTRDVAVLPGVLERVEEANRVPVEELRARARVNGRERARWQEYAREVEAPIISVCVCVFLLLRMCLCVCVCVCVRARAARVRVRVRVVA